MRPNAVVRFVVFELPQIYFRHQAILPLVLLEQALNAGIGARLSHLSPPVDDWNTPTGGAQDDIIREESFLPGRPGVRIWLVCVPSG